MSFAPQIKIPATYLRGGTSKGVFFNLNDLPKAAQQAGENRDQLLLRVIGSPDPYGKQTDGMGGATSSTSKVVIMSKSEQADHDVDYLFGQVAIDKALIDWSGNCGNLTAAVGSYAVENGLVDADKIPNNGIIKVRIWQVNIQKTIIAHVPITDGIVQETGDFELDGVTFPAAEVKVEFINPVDKKDALFPTGQLIDDLDVPKVGTFKATMINAGIPIIFLDAAALGYDGTELQSDINTDPEALATFETIRAHGAIKMGLIKTLDEAKQRQHTPKVAIVGDAKSYSSSNGKSIAESDIDLNVRALSMGLLHHAMMGTAAVAIGAAAAIPGTMISQRLANRKDPSAITFGHPSGVLKVGAVASQLETANLDTTTENKNTAWTINKVSMSRSARILMEGNIRVPFEI